MPNDENNTFCELTKKQEAILSAYISSYVQLTSDFTLQELCKNVYDIIFAKNKNETEALINISFIPKILSTGIATDEDIFIALKRNKITHNDLTELQYGDFKDIAKVKEFLMATENIKCDEPELIPYRKGNKWGYCDRDKNIIIECEYSHTYPFREGLGRVAIGTDGYNYAFVNKSGNRLTIDLLHNANKALSHNHLVLAYDFCEGVAKVCPIIPGTPPWEGPDECGYIDKFGKEIIPCNYCSSPYVNRIGNYFSEGLVRAQKDDKWGLLDKNGNNITPFKYDEIKDFAQGFARVGISGVWGYLDKTGKEIFPVKLLDEDYIIEERARVCIDGKFGFYDKSGNEIIHCKYDDVLPFSQGLAGVLIRDIEFVSENYPGMHFSSNGKYYVEHNKWGVVDKNGNQIVPCKYNNMLPFSEGLAGVRFLMAKEENFNDISLKFYMSEIHKWGFINRNGNEIIPFIYDRVLSFSEGLAGVSIKNKWGFIDKNGNEIIPCRYKEVRSYNEGIAMVLGDSYRWGLIDKNGSQIVSCQYTEIHKFKGGLANVKIGSQTGYINTKGVEIIPCGEYEVLFGFSEGRMMCQNKGKYGFVDRSGRVVTPCIYRKASHFKNGFVLVEHGYIDKEGIQYWEEDLVL